MTIKLRVWVETNAPGSRVETIVEEDPYRCCTSEDDRQEQIEDMVLETVEELIRYGYEVIE